MTYVHRIHIWEYQGSPAGYSQCKSSLERTTHEDNGTDPVALSTEHMPHGQKAMSVQAHPRHSVWFLW